MEKAISKDLINKKWIKTKIKYLYLDFNTLHPGHIRLLKFAKSLGNELVVGIISKKLYQIKIIIVIIQE